VDSSQFAHCLCPQVKALWAPVIGQAPFHAPVLEAQWELLRPPQVLSELIRVLDLMKELAQLL
jgi:hypothetical protein